MSGVRLKKRPKVRLSGVNALLIFLLVALLLLVVALFVAIQLKNSAQQEPPNTVSIGGQEVEVDESLPQSEVSQEEFSTQEDGEVTYSGEALYGVDVSSHQGEVDWAAVAEDGNAFAMLRIGYRGYTAGAISEDERFQENYSAARENGMKVGVYFFSQAVTPEEAEEEARQVLEWLDSQELDLPVAYDWEVIGTGKTGARTDKVDGETATGCAVAFCEVVEQGGYRPMVYCNGMLGYLHYDVSRLTDYPIWYAEYQDYPSFAYAFEIWQYTESGTVDGISGKADRNIWFQASVDADTIAQQALPREG